jgi:hypothetical protein
VRKHNFRSLTAGPHSAKLRLFTSHCQGRSCIPSKFNVSSKLATPMSVAVANLQSPSKFCNYHVASIVQHCAAKPLAVSWLP